MAKIARIVTRLNVGGPARQALLLTKALSPRFETSLIAGVPPVEEGRMIDPDVKVELAPLVRPVRPATDVRAVLAVRRRLRRMRPDIVHTHMSKAGVVGRVAALTLKDRPRIVHTFHGHVLTGYFGDSVRRVVLTVEKALARYSDALIAVSEEVRDDLVALGVAPASRFRVIPLGFDLSPFLAVEGHTRALRRRYGIGDQDLVVGVIGRLVPIKDHTTLFDAIASLPNVHLVVLGDGEMRAELERRALELGIAERTHFAGWWLDVASAIGDMDIVALTSRNEGSPVSLIEALACSRPVVATDVGGVRSVVEDGVSGFLVPAGDSLGVARFIEKLMHDPDLRRTMGIAGRRHVVAKFGHDRLVSDIRALYEELLQGRSRRQSQT